LAAIDVYLAPLSDGVSTRRGSMMAGLEHGLAIVGTRGEATDEVLAREHGRAMLLADVNAMPAFEAHVRTLLVDAERRRELGSAAEALYEREFAWPRIAEKLMAILSGCESHSSQSRDAGARPARIHELPGARHAVATLAAAEGTAGR
jgi:glycosyltransferase involved in cell wall biosynthesis